MVTVVDEGVHTNERIVEMLERVLTELEAIRAQQSELAETLRATDTSTDR